MCCTTIKHSWGGKTRWCKTAAGWLAVQRSSTADDVKASSDGASIDVDVVSASYLGIAFLSILLASPGD
jgi:hypothetical protein